MLKKVYRHYCLSRTRVFEWFARFKDSREDLEDDEQSGRPKTSTEDLVEKIGQSPAEEFSVKIYDSLSLSQQSFEQGPNIDSQKADFSCTTICTWHIIPWLYESFLPKNKQQ